MKSQIKEIKEDINKLGNDGFNVQVKLDELEHYAEKNPEKNAEKNPEKNLNEKVQETINTLNKIVD